MYKCIWYDMYGDYLFKVYTYKQFFTFFGLKANNGMQMTARKDDRKKKTKNLDWNLIMLSFLDSNCFITYAAKSIGSEYNIKLQENILLV